MGHLFTGRRFHGFEEAFGSQFRGDVIARAGWRKKGTREGVRFYLGESTVLAPKIDIRSRLCIPEDNFFLLPDFQNLLSKIYQTEKADLAMWVTY